MRRMLPFDCVHLYRRNIYWEPASSETDDVHFLSLYRLGSIVEVCCANRWQSAYIQTDTACVLLWQTTTRAQSTQLLWHLSDNHRLWPEDCYTSHSLSRPSTGGAISSCPLLVHPMHTLSAASCTHVCTTHLDAPTLQEHMPAADAPYYKRSQPDHCAVHSSHRRVAMRVPPFPSISRHAALSHRLASTCAPAPPSFRGFEGLLMHGTLGHKSFHH